ncbi:hypothetical protein CWO27_22410 [Vibrio sp. 10N.286.51.C3]|uniref:hypothetical protein n=1 Tax=unclassified Vibrio TaxID=2614977 RepID=UPI000D3AEEBF|nr:MULTISPECIES: hypothetical protein [unclassified Vibrio]PTP11651.1 hypothetical protein CWO27_22410 [Vibrio sp. 10N.286.51.C3]TKE64589.1 hypothetical protein FCV45_13525 [Vibrio sp. F12]
MNIEWFSRKGAERDQNSDFTHIFESANYLYLIMVDPSNKGNNGNDFAHWWGALVVEEIKKEEFDNFYESLVNVMKKIQPKIRLDYLKETASYAILRITKTTLCVEVIHAGDCRVALRKEVELTYKTNVHTLANRSQWFGEEHYLCESRHLVTKTLNARRFSMPDYTKFQMNRSEILDVMSDGYWIEYLVIHKQVEGLCDDASRLSIDFSKLNCHSIDSDVVNYVFH